MVVKPKARVPLKCTVCGGTWNPEVPATSVDIVVKLRKRRAMACPSETCDGELWLVRTPATETPEGSS